MADCLAFFLCLVLARPLIALLLDLFGLYLLFNFLFDLLRGLIFGLNGGDYFRLLDWLFFDLLRLFCFFYFIKTHLMHLLEGGCKAACYLFELNVSGGTNRRCSGVVIVW